MFSKITDFAVNRSITEAFGFYLVTTIFLIGLSTTIVHLMGMFGIGGGTSSFFDGGQIHTLVGSIWVLVLSSMILSSKKMTNDFLSVLLVILGIALAYTTSIMLGMVPVAVLTMLKAGGK